MEPMYATRNKIVRYKLEEDCVLLKKSGLTHKQIAEELNNSGKLPNNDLINRDDVDRFIKRVPSVEKTLVKESKDRLVQVVNTNFDIIHELGSLFSRTKNLLEAMEERAEEQGRRKGSDRWSLEKNTCIFADFFKI
jgi:lipid II:glycine glycyltransferase (peptidoglycan interpeptide bridge formation enzyme)